MGPLHLATRSMHGCTVVDIGGEVDIATAPHLRTYVGHLLDVAATGRMVLNLSAVTFMDACGLAALVAIRCHASAATIPIQLAALPPGVRMLLRITHLDTTFAIVAEAVPPADHPHMASPRMATP